MAAITAKLRELGIDIDDVFAFIDCNCLQIERVGGGPRQGGADANRWVSNVQRAFYNGWKSIHGLKHSQLLLHRALRSTCMDPHQFVETI